MYDHYFGSSDITVDSAVTKMSELFSDLTFNYESLLANHLYTQHGGENEVYGYR